MVKPSWTLGCIAAGLFAALGRYPVSWLLSKRSSYAAPKILRSADRYYIKCPSDNTMHVELEGSENTQPLVLLHGLNSSSRQWYYQRLFLRKHFRLVIIDLPGHGWSPQPADLSIPVLAADLAAVLTHFQIFNPIIYGHSMGAMVAMQYCADAHTPLVKSVILQHASYTNPFQTTPFSPWTQLLQKPVLIPFFGFVKRHPLIFKIIGRLNYLNGLSILFYRFLFFAGRQTADQLRFMCRIAALNPPEVTADGLLRCMEFDVTASLKTITVPALVMGAAYDRIIKPDACKHISRQVGHGHFTMINGGHQSIMEVPDEVNKALIEFLIG
ncbi:alpha/beta hydrolase [Mucilaginibacter limnophilus]|uniref:Alpha/beta hydrolase n=1 Tax=Mucilaginibacter limnophilus TaxID=1932778 RepID=A0A437MFP8_9SPHI|nr:alpha/beta hydrolase [Mucilaginibacter limnophilus]RVT96461.1 alpha/beta hydrolase [Mucilaginibacter limnophilus]